MLIQVNGNESISLGGLARLKTELSDLKHVIRFEVIERLRNVKVGGNGIDNSKYMAAREELSIVDGRIRELVDILRHVELILPHEVDAIIRLGSIVVVQLDGADLETYTLVKPADASPGDRMISHESPLGHALLNRTVGDEAMIETADGLIRFGIVAVN